MPLRRRLRWNDNLEISVAPPEYVVLRKLEYYREGRSEKHPADIQAISEVTGLNLDRLDPWLDQLGLRSIWAEIEKRQS